VSAIGERALPGKHTEAGAMEIGRAASRRLVLHFRYIWPDLPLAAVPL
jgi:hypothetical protein